METASLEQAPVAESNASLPVDALIAPSAPSPSHRQRPAAEAIAEFHPGRHLPELDAVRGLAILIVVIFHASLEVHDPANAISRGMMNALILGRSGVDLFFVLSGFLITGILLDTRQANNYFRAFYARRTLRIFPLYYAVLLLLLVVAPRLLSVNTPALHVAVVNQGWLWLYGANFAIMFVGSRSMGLLAHCWSLAVEEQFYLVWPLVVLLLGRRALMRACVAAIVLALVFRIVLMVVWNSKDLCYVLTPARMDTLCIGALLALWVRRPGGLASLVRPARVLVPVLMVALVAICGLRGLIHGQRHDMIMPTIGYTIVAFMFGGLLVLALASPANTWLGRIFASRVLRFFGKFSYAMYLLHYPMLVFLTPWFKAHLAPHLGRNLQVRQATYVMLVLCLSVALAMLSWHLLESPFLQLKRYFKYRYTPTEEPGTPMTNVIPVLQA